MAMLPAAWFLLISKQFPHNHKAKSHGLAMWLRYLGTWFCFVLGDSSWTHQREGLLVLRNYLGSLMCPFEGSGDFEKQSWHAPEGCQILQPHHGRKIEVSSFSSLLKVSGSSIFWGGIVCPKGLGWMCMEVHDYVGLDKNQMISAMTVQEGTNTG